MSENRKLLTQKDINYILCHPELTGREIGSRLGYAKATINYARQKLAAQGITEPTVNIPKLHRIAIGHESKL